MTSLNEKSKQFAKDCETEIRQKISSTMGDRLEK